LTAKELKKLDIKSNDFSDKEYEEIFKLISQYIEKPLILYFDDIEYYQLLDKEKELGKIIKELYTNLNSILIILTSLSESWDYFKDVLETILEMELKNVKTLKNFKENQIKTFYIKSMEGFWQKNQLKMPSDPLFPIDEKIFKIIFLRSGGNPRLVKKLLKTAIDQELYERQVENLWELKEIIKK
ncbi:MAG: hypothetical protein ACTSO9_15985, partial [Candidatus Helarchaeota archaeon]